MKKYNIPPEIFDEMDYADYDDEPVECRVECDTEAEMRQALFPKNGIIPWDAKIIFAGKTPPELNVKSKYLIIYE